MRNFHFTFLFIIALSLFASLDVTAQKKRAQTSMKFLSVSPSAHAAALSNAATSLELGSASVFYNPAAIAHGNNTFDISGGVVEYIADINYSNVAFTYRPLNRRVGVFGFNLVSVDYGDILGTVLSSDNPLGYEETGLIKPTAVALGFAYANAITDQFSVGANFRYVKQDLSSAILGVDASTGSYISNFYAASVIALDFGILYKTGFESLNIAMSIQNFAREVAFDIEKQELPMTFKIGVSMDLIDLTSLNKKSHSLLASVDAHRPRDYDEQIIVGLDYGFMGRFNIRGGYTMPSKDEKGLSIGGGITQPIGDVNLAVDYAYTEFGVFGNVNRISFRLDF